MKTVTVTGEYIQLNQLLKLENAVSTCGEAKALIEQGKVSVNGQVESAVRKKIRSGDVVKAPGLEITVLCRG